MLYPVYYSSYWLLKMSNKRREARVSRTRRQGGVHNILLMNLARDVVVCGTGMMGALG